MDISPHLLVRTSQIHLLTVYSNNTNWPCNKNGHFFHPYQMVSWVEPPLFSNVEWVQRC